VIVAENGIDVASLVNAHVREIVIVADLVVVDEEGMAAVNGIAQLGEGQSSIEAAVDINVEGGNVVVGDTDFGRLIGSNPFTIITWNGGAGWVKSPCLALIHAGTDVNIGKVKTGNIHVVIPL
jgi:hypothetical protein